MYKKVRRESSRVISPAESKSPSSRQPLSSPRSSERGQSGISDPELRQSSPTAAQLCSSPKNKLFLQNLTISVLPVKIVKARLDLFSKRIRDSGGAVIPFRLQGTLDPATTHYLVENSIDAEELLGILQVAKQSLEQIVADLARVHYMPFKWMTMCLSTSTRCPEAEFSLTRRLHDLITSKQSLDRPQSLVRTVSCSTGTTTLLAAAQEGLQRSAPAAMSSGGKSKRPRDSIPDNTSSYEESSTDSESGAEDDSDADELTSSPVRPLNKFASKFVCGHASSVGKKNLNTHITDQLEKLQKTYDSTGDQWRAMSYQKAINSIRSHPTRISRVEEVKGLKHIGAGIGDKVIEILETGACEKVAAYCDDNEVNQAITLFCGIHGVSSKTALKWAASKNLRTLEDLQTKNVKLSRVQLIGLKHYHDFLDRIPREEVAEIENTVREAALKLQDGLELITCGSYRRGKPTCGDVDILVTHPDGKSHRNVFLPLLENLKNSGFITDELLISEESTQKKFLGVCRLPKPATKYRRLDIIVVPYNEFGCALLYFTGSAHFNRSMRSLAHKDNMALSHHSLNKNSIRVGKKKISDGEPIPNMTTERAVFEQLGLPYRTPEERDHG